LAGPPARPWISRARRGPGHCPAPPAVCRQGRRRSAAVAPPDRGCRRRLRPISSSSAKNAARVIFMPFWFQFLGKLTPDRPELIPQYSRAAALVLQSELRCRALSDHSVTGASRGPCRTATSRYWICDDTGSVQGHRLGDGRRLGLAAGVLAELSAPINPAFSQARSAAVAFAYVAALHAEPREP
jgi:hypothetical protein